MKAYGEKSGIILTAAVCTTRTGSGLCEMERAHRLSLSAAAMCAMRVGGRPSVRSEPDLTDRRQSGWSWFKATHTHTHTHGSVGRSVQTSRLIGQLYSTRCLTATHAARPRGPHRKPPSFPAQTCSPVPWKRHRLRLLMLCYGLLHQHHRQVFGCTV